MKWIRTINQKSLFLDRGSGCMMKISNDGLGTETLAHAWIKNKWTRLFVFFLQNIIFFKHFSYEWQRNGHMCWKTEVESVIRMWHSFSQATSDESELRVATSWSMILEVSCVFMRSTVETNRQQTIGFLKATIPVTFWHSRIYRVSV